MNIEYYIGQLLYRHQCVTVPAFGAFLTETQSAQLLDGTNSFYPPKKVISFNFYLKNNDGLLANHIAQSKKIDYETAVQEINKEVELWKSGLQNNQNIILKNIGTIGLNFQGNLVFEPSNQVNFFTDAFGLSNFIAPKIKRELLEKEVEIVQEKETIVLVPTQKEGNSYLKYAAVFMVGLGTIGFFGNNFYQNQQLEQAQIVENQVQKEVQNKIQEATFFIKSPLPNVTLAIKEVDMNYHIVAGAFRNERNAQRIFEKLSNLGFKARRIEKNNFGLFPVLFGSYPTYLDAQKALQEIRKTESPEAWLMIKDLK
jgi:hypothetical protein